MQEGHYSRDCPNNDENNSDKARRQVHTTWSVYNTSDEVSLSRHEVLLDPQANVSVMFPQFLSDIRRVKNRVSTKDIAETAGTEPGERGIFGGFD